MKRRTQRERERRENHESETVERKHLDYLHRKNSRVKLRHKARAERSFGDGAEARGDI